MYSISVLLLPDNRDPGEQFLFLGRNNERKTKWQAGNSVNRTIGGKSAENKSKCGRVSEKCTLTG